MGGIGAMESINRVIEKHGDEIREAFLSELPEEAKELITDMALSNEVYHIETAWVTKNGGTLPGPSLDIDMLAEQYDDCDIGY